MDDYNSWFCMYYHALLCRDNAAIRSTAQESSKKDELMNQ